MSRFNHSAKRIDAIAKTYFAARREASENLKKAEQLYKENRRPAGVWVAEPAEVARVTRIEADYEDARAVMANVEGAMAEQALADIAAERNTLAKSLNVVFRVDPAAIDYDTMTLLNSGVCTSEEYRYLMAKAEADENNTMVRLIGAAAEKSRIGMGDVSRMDSAARMESVALTSVFERSKQYGASRYLEDFDGATELFKHAVNNPAVEAMWDDATANFVENF